MSSTEKTTPMVVPTDDYEKTAPVDTQDIVPGMPGFKILTVMNNPRAIAFAQGELGPNVPILPYADRVNYLAFPETVLCEAGTGNALYMGDVLFVETETHYNRRMGIRHTELDEKIAAQFDHGPEVSGVSGLKSIGTSHTEEIAHRLRM